MMQNLDVGYFHADELRSLGFGGVGENVSVAKNCHILNPDRIFLGSDVKIHPFCSLVAYKDSSISIGSSVHIGGYSLLFGLKQIKIGSFVSISTHVRMFTASDDFSGNSLLGCDVPAELRTKNEQEILISDHCGLGSGAMLLPGVRLEEGSVLGANSMLKNGATLPWHIYVGNPAVRVSERPKTPLELAAKYPRRHSR